jgi:hypothetical protein
MWLSPRRAAAIAMLVATGACNGDIAPPFVIEGTGSLEGLIFFDADRNGAFDPPSGDDAAPNVTLLVRVRGTEETFTDGQVTSDANGRFSFTGIPVGTHDLFIDTTTAPAGVAFCQNPLQVSVRNQQVRFVSIEGRGGCIIDIADAEAQGLGAFFTIQGLVTAAPGQIRNEASYIEDATGGVQLFDSDLLGLGIEVGDRIEVSGTIGQFGLEFELLNDVRLNAIVKAFAVPIPDTVTTLEIANAGSPPENPLQGRLVHVLAAEQTSAFATGGGRNAQFDDGSGVVEVRIDVGLIANAANVATQFPAGSCYNITGVIGSFNSVAQLKPRTLADMVVVPCP